MNIFKKFKVTFNLKNPSRKDRAKGEDEVRCLKYKVYSEFTTEQVFETNPRHLHEKPFTPTQPRRLQVKSLSENNIASISEEKEEIKNLDSETPTTNQTIDTETNTLRQEQDETQSPTKQRKEKGILKNKNEKVNIEKEQFSVEDNYTSTNFNEEITYEQFEPIDDQLREEDIYYFEEEPQENPDHFVVHKNPAVHFEESDHEYEEPVHKSEKQDEKSAENPLYNLKTHPKLNPTVGGMDDEYARSIGLNTFGNTRKLQYPGDYSLEAASIFFGEQNDYDC